MKRIKREEKTELFAWLMLGRRRIGAFQMNEYDPNGCGSNDGHGR
jgi:hypothetical protein